MPTVETYYLIDFENVKEDGLSCSAKLGSHDHVHIFSTENTPKISFKTLSAFNSTEVCSHIVPAGKQSLDMHLVSYLGYLIGKKGGNQCKYVIVSNDGDYNNIITFMKKEGSAKIVRQASIGPVPKKEPAQTPTAKSSNTTNTSSKLNNEIQEILSKASFNNEIISYVASSCAKHYNGKNAKQTIYKAIVAKYGQKQGLNIYNHIKRVL